MTNMSVSAVGSYLRTLANIQRLTEAEVTEQAGVQTKYMWRLESAQIKEPSARVLRALTVAVNGSWDDIGDLIIRDDVNEDDGRARALAWAAQAGLISPGTRVILDRASPDELDRAAEELRRRAAMIRGN